MRANELTDTPKLEEKGSDKLWESVYTFLTMELMRPDFATSLLGIDLELVSAHLTSPKEGEEKLPITLSQVEKKLFSAKFLSPKFMQRNVRTLTLGDVENMTRFLDVAWSLFWMILEKKYPDTKNYNIGIREGFRVYRIPDEID